MREASGSPLVACMQALSWYWRGGVPLLLPVGCSAGGGESGDFLTPVRLGWDKATPWKLHPRHFLFQRL